MENQQNQPTTTREEYTFRAANTADIKRIMLIISQAKAQMKRLGSHQWQEGYPAQEDIESDITHNRAFILSSGCMIIAYAAISINGEPAYNALEGKWLSDQDYVVVHRMAVAEEMKKRGVATYFFKCAEQYAISKEIHSFRVDTNFDNHYMLHLLEKAGFVHCGEVFYDRGRGSRMAFEKQI